MDAPAMHAKLQKTRSGTPCSSVDERSENLGDVTGGSGSSNKTKESLPVAAATNEESREELRKLREELGEVKSQLVDLTQVKQLFLLLSFIFNWLVYFSLLLPACNHPVIILWSFFSRNSLYYYNTWSVNHSLKHMPGLV